MAISLQAMKARLTKDFRFEAAHTLPSLPDGHKCRQMHGHSFKVEISIEGEVDPAIGWIYDHKLISNAMNPLLEQLEQERNRLSHGVDLQNSSYQVYQLLYQNDRSRGFSCLNSSD